jgi:CheY-like chemotaxis protein
MGSNLRGIRILVVDDDPDTLDIVGAMLRLAGAIVTPVGSADEAMAAVREATPHVMVSDISMPDRDGLSLVKELRALSPLSGGCLPAIALTADGSEATRYAATKLGFDRFLVKPVEPDKLTKAVHDLFNAVS